ncbi:MAG: nitronate monooxygenase [Chloroflexi bacterium]|nr:nitronate monooxygenase [Chloroflexota bacterium]
MKATRLSKQLNIQVPIIQAGMPWVANAELAAAVSNAGGLGIIAPNAGLPVHGDEIENFHAQLRKLKALTTRPFGACLDMGHPQLDALVRIATEEAVPVVVTVGGSPNLHSGHLKDAGITVIHVVSSVHQARSAEARGADAIIAVGFEAASYGCSDELTLMTLIPQVVDTVEIPVIAAGGIADGRGLAAALSLGAGAVYIGTRFIATHECVAHPNLKDAIINAIDTSTTIVRWDSSHIRLLKNSTTESIKGLEESKDKIEEIEALLSDDKARSAVLEGKIDQGKIYCGAGAGLITEIMSAADIVKTMVQQADSALSKAK